ncbi:MAG: PhnD/SsuA/transferrin family substrate-binding protein [Pseudomonadota bacterium]
MKKTGSLVLIAALTCFLSFPVCAHADTVKIGVLAKNGPVKALNQWKTTGDYLSGKIPGTTFEIVPLGFDEVNPAVQNGTVDFFLVNSSMFITAKVKYGAQAVATMINSRQGKPLRAFGGVIFTNAENDDIKTLNDLKGHSFMAVEESSFGGWQMAYKEFIDAGIDPGKDFSQLTFGGKHDNVVLAVQNGAVEAGTVRTDTLERMVAAGVIDMDEFRIIAPRSHDGFPFVCSTALYPEWPLAKTAKTDGELVAKVVEALKQMNSDDPAAKDAKVVGWADALDYDGIESLQKTLGVGAYASAKLAAK